MVAPEVFFTVLLIITLAVPLFVVFFPLKFVTLVHRGLS